MEPFQAWSNLPSTSVESFVTYQVPGQAAANLTLDEPVVAADPTSVLGLPLFNGYSANSNAAVGMRDVVYCNYCREEDFAYLASIGVSVVGKVALCRYGSVFRGQKAFFAEQAGAVSALLYSDPADDGYAKVMLCLPSNTSCCADRDVKAAEFPNGPGRPANGGQRGTLVYGWLCPGDPGAARLATGICGNISTLVPAIPVQPIAWSQAQLLLSALTGPYVPSPLGWQGEGERREER
jgi:N-acetylated-alpha-linked acidic dipeptidase